MATTKHFLRDSWLAASYYSGLTRFYNALNGRKQGIISFHNVLPVKYLKPFDVYNVDATAAVFDYQLGFLKKHFRVLPIAELENPDVRGFFLTVDDGMLNNHEIIAPILEKHHLTALFAVCPALIDGNIPHIWRDHLYLLFQQHAGQKVLLPTNNYERPQLVEDVNQLTRQLKKYVYDHQIADVYGLVRAICNQNGWLYQQMDDDPLRFRFMNWQQINDLSQRGHRIASHTMTHRVLRFLPDHEKQYELEESKKQLEKHLESPVEVVVYPYGGAEIDAITVKLAQELGYTIGLMNVQQHTLPIPALTRARFAFPPVADVPHLYAVASGYAFFGKKLLNYFSK